MKDIFEQLTDEHEQIAELVMELCDTSADEVEVRAELRARLRVEILAHARSEEQQLYAPLRAMDEGLAATLDEHVDQHDELADVLTELGERDLDDDEILELAEDLRMVIEDHADDEENDLFPRARNLIDEDDAQIMGERYRREHRRRVELLRSDDFDDMSAEELDQEARSRNIAESSELSRDQLIAELRQH